MDNITFIAAIKRYNICRGIVSSFSSSDTQRPQRDFFISVLHSWETKKKKAEFRATLTWQLVQVRDTNSSGRLSFSRTDRRTRILEIQKVFKICVMFCAPVWNCEEKENKGDT